MDVRTARRPGYFSRKLRRLRVRSLDLQGNDGAGLLEQEVDLAGAVLGGPVIGRDADLRDQLLEDILLRQRAFELGKYLIAAQQGAHVDVTHGSQQTHVQQIQLEGG